MLGFLFKKPHRTAGAAVALLSAIAAGISASSSPTSDQTNESFSFALPLHNLWEDIGITSSFPVSAGGLGFPSQHHFFGSSNPSTDSNKDDCECSKECLSKNSIANAASAVAPAVVNISRSSGRRGGSGTIIDPDGFILTCAHVVVDFNNGEAYSVGPVTVKLQDGRSFDGDVVNVDCHSDVAIVKIKSETPLPSARLGNSAQLRAGDWVVAVGCPLALQNTVTAGIISCVNRKGSDLDLIGFDGADSTEFIQTDCALNQGSSGGPLVNLDGEIVGMNVLKILQTDGLSFAVPIDIVTKIIEHFREERNVRPCLGLMMLGLDPLIVSQLKVRDLKFPDIISGVLVPVVTPGEHAGFWAHDGVISFDGKPVKSINETVDITDNSVKVPLRVVVVPQGSKYVNLSVGPEEAKSS